MDHVAGDGAPLPDDQNEQLAPEQTEEEAAPALLAGDVTSRLLIARLGTSPRACDLAIAGFSMASLRPAAKTTDAVCILARVSCFVLRVGVGRE